MGSLLRHLVGDLILESLDSIRDGLLNQVGKCLALEFLVLRRGLFQNASLICRLSLNLNLGVRSVKRLRIDLRRVFGRHAVVRVGQVRMGVERGARRALSVVIGDNHMSFARGEGLDGKGDPRHAAHALAIHLHKGKVATFYLVRYGIASTREVYHNAVLANLKRHAPFVAPCQPISLGRLNLVGNIRAVRQRVRGGLGTAISAGCERGHDGTGLIGGPINHNGLIAGELDGQHRAFQRRRALCNVIEALHIHLAQPHAAADYVIGDQELRGSRPL